MTMIFSRFLGIAALLLICAFSAAIATAADFAPSGPSGGTGGSPFQDGALTGTQGPAEVVEIRVRSGAYIDAVQIVVLLNGSEVAYPMHGGSGGTLSVFRLQPGEYIVAIGGKYGRYVDSLFVRTNTGRTNRWEGNGGSVQYYYSAPQGTRIRGFLGRSGAYVDAIGAIISTDR